MRRAEALAMVSLFLCVMAVIVPSSAREQGTWTPSPDTHGLELSISPSSQNARIGDPIPIELSISNHSGRYMRFWYTPLHERLRVYIRDQQNVLLPETKRVFGIVSQGRSLPLYNDSAFKFDVDASVYGLITRPGTYTMSACLDVGSVVCTKTSAVVDIR